MPSQAINPLLLSTEHISKGSSIAFAVIFGVLSVLIGVKLRTIKSLRFTHTLIFLLCLGQCYHDIVKCSRCSHTSILVRTATYAVRAKVAASADVEGSKGLVIAAGVLIIAGYLFLLEAVCDLVTAW